jgi:hypothetical protein
MQLTISSSDDLSLACQGWAPPPACTEIVVDAPRVRRFTNMFLRSPINVRVRVTPTELDEVSYAGLFSMCDQLQHQPFVDTSRATNMAAMLKGLRQARFSLHWVDASRCRDMRQMLWGCAVITGNGIDRWDFSSLVGPDAMRNFAGGTKFPTANYDAILRNLHRQAVAGTLPRPMHGVDFGRATYSRNMADERQYLVDYGWDLIDGGPATADVAMSPFERQVIREIDDRLSASRSPIEGVDMSPVLKRSRGGIMLTTRHCLHTYHWRPSRGDTIATWDGHTAKVVDVDIEGGLFWSADAVVSTLDRDLPVTPCQVLPREWQATCPLLAQLGPPSPYADDQYPPLVWIGRDDRPQLVDIDWINRDTHRVCPRLPADPLRAAWYRPAVTGDSGSPMCWVHRGRLVLSHLITNGGTGMGSAAFYFRPWLDEVAARTGHRLDDVGD